MRLWEKWKVDNEWHILIPLPAGTWEWHNYHRRRQSTFSQLFSFLIQKNIVKIDFLKHASKLHGMNSCKLWVRFFGCFQFIKQCSIVRWITCFCTLFSHQILHMGRGNHSKKHICSFNVDSRLGGNNYGITTKYSYMQVWNQRINAAPDTSRRPVFF